MWVFSFSRALPYPKVDQKRFGVKNLITQFLGMISYFFNFSGKKLIVKAEVVSVRQCSNFLINYFASCRPK